MAPSPTISTVTTQLRVSTRRLALLYYIIHYPFISIVYNEYTSSCREEEDLAYAGHIFDVQWHPKPLTVSQQTARMFTYYPWRDKN